MEIECLIKTNKGGLKVIVDGKIYELHTVLFFEEHYFTPSRSDANFCEKCNQYFTHPVHTRSKLQTP